MKKILVFLLVVLSIIALVSCDPGLLKKDPEQQQSGEEGGGSGSGDSGSGGGQSGDQGGSGSGGADDASGSGSGSGSGPVQSDYHVGDIGPAGGYIFYDKGSYTNGWRYLEAAPADMRVINGFPTVDATSDIYKNAAIENQYVDFGYYRTSGSGENLYVNGTTTWTTSCTQSGVGAGKTNTQLLLDAMGETAYMYPTYSKNKEIKSANYAAKLVDLLTYKVGEVTFDDWFIPSLGELTLMYQQLYMNNIGGFGAYTYVSSSECDKDKKNYPQNTEEMYTWSFSTGTWNVVLRDNGSRVRPVRAF